MKRITARHQIFTPSNIVQKMIEMSGFNGQQTVWEPSFGTGNFLVSLVRIVLESGMHEYLDNIYGCEIDESLYEEAINRLNALLNEYGVSYQWKNLLCCDAFDYPDKLFDIVIGNPPYIRIHNMDKQERARVEKLRFSTGMNDLYVSFFELGLNHLLPHGVLVFITPNSYIKNASQQKFRKHIASMVTDIVDYGSYQVFDNALTYTCIARLAKDYCGLCKYTKMVDLNTVKYTVVSNVAETGFLFVEPADSVFLHRATDGPVKLEDIADIRYGIATNADRIYINPDDVESEILRPVIKGSTLQKQAILYPYIRDTEIIPEFTLREKYPRAYGYLLAHKPDLEKRDMDGSGPFYRYARTQGLNHVDKEKIVIQHIVSNDAECCSALIADAETLVYSGIMIIPHEGYLDKVYDTICSRDFCRYVKIIGKDMGGGYKAFTPKDIKRYSLM